MTLHEDISSVLIGEEEIRARVAELAQEINNDYQGKPLVIVCILKGSVVFFADLVRRLTMPVRFDFMALSSYENARVSSGIVRVAMDLYETIEDKDILIVEDIIDTGHTLSHLRELLSARAPKSIRFCTLLDKPSRREANIHPDYCGFTIEDHFVVGYGLDCGGEYRQLPYVAIMK